MSCPEVVYQAYYPYLYQRSATSASGVARTNPFPAFSHQYDRFNMQRTLEQHQQGYSLAEASNQQHGSSSHHSHSSAASVSSGGGMGSPGSPVIRHKEEDQQTTGRNSSGGGGGSGVAEEDDDEDEASSTGSRAQYVSANCVVFTHYSGDVAAVVDEHFNRALSYSENKGSGATNSHGKASSPSPMSARNFPPSFWNSNYQTTASVTPHHATEIFSDPYHNSTSAASDPWHSHYQQYSAAAAHHHRAVHEYHHHHHNMAQYGGLLLPPATRLPPHVTASHQYSKGSLSHESWSTAATHSAAHHSHAHTLDTTGYTTYPSMADW